jgi:hypothetical protein
LCTLKGVDSTWQITSGPDASGWFAAQATDTDGSEVSITFIPGANGQPINVEVNVIDEFGESTMVHLPPDVAGTLLSLAHDYASALDV